MEWVLAHAKALLGCLIALLGAIQVGLNDGLTGQETVGAIVAGLVGLAVVFGTPNKGQEDAQEVVDAVRILVPDAAKADIDAAVISASAGGVLKTVKR